MKRILLVCTVLNLSLLIPVMGVAQMKGDAKAGKAKYDANCVGCHGTSGKGDGPAAKALNPKPQDHTDGNKMNALSDQYLFDIIKNGGAAMKKSPLMPAGKSKFKDQDVWDLVAYVRSLANPPYKPGK